jgi:hypothetical protein
MCLKAGKKERIIPLQNSEILSPVTRHRIDPPDTVVHGREGDAVGYLLDLVFHAGGLHFLFLTSEIEFGSLCRHAGVAPVSGGSERMPANPLPTTIFVTLTLQVRDRPPLQIRYLRHDSPRRAALHKVPYDPYSPYLRPALRR